MNSHLRHAGLPSISCTLNHCVLLGVFVLVLTCVGTGAREVPSLIVVTVSGTVRGPDGPVGDAWIGVNGGQEFTGTITDIYGHYSATVQTDGRLWLHARPKAATRLTQANIYLENRSSSFIQDFTVAHGHLLAIRPMGSDGTQITTPLTIQIQSMSTRLPQNQWYFPFWNDETRRYEAVIIPEIYSVTIWSQSTGYPVTRKTFDLRTADAYSDLPLATADGHPIPYDPPDASKISIGAPNGLGEAIVSGAPGAALPLAHVLLVNLRSNHQADSISAEDGSFSARIYAPPGSDLMIKHGPPDGRWNDLPVGLSEGVNPFPGTIIHVPHTHSGDRYKTPFASAGACNVFFDDLNTTPNYVSNAWSMEGTLGPVVVDGQWTRLSDGTYDGRLKKALYLGGLNWTHPALADLDHDGDLDLVVGERSGRLVFYRNRGTATSPDWQFEQYGYAGVATGNWAYPVFADVNGDGALDLFVGTGDGNILVYYSQGTALAAAWPASPSLTLQAGKLSSPALIDVDGDGDLDLVAGYQGGKLYLYRNTGTLSHPAWQLATDNYGSIAESGDCSVQPAFLDLSGDGTPDLLLGDCGSLVWYKNTGSRSNPLWTRMGNASIPYSGSSMLSPAAGDWNGDGRLDVVTGEHLGVLHFFRNEGVSQWVEQTFSFPFDFLADSAPALGDWNNDGRLDLLVGQVHGNIWMHTNRGSRTAPDWHPEGMLLTLPWTNHPHAFPALADIDGDGDLDLFIGEGGWQGSGAGGNIWFYRNMGNPSVPNWVLVTNKFLDTDFGGSATPVFADIDGDGDLDLFIGDENGTLTFVENLGSRSSPAWAAPVRRYAGLSVSSYSAAAFLDVDNDGDLDLLIGGGDGTIAYVRNKGTAQRPAWELVTTEYPGLTVGEHAMPAAADLNGDGRKDLIIGSGDGGLSLFLYEGPGSPPEPGSSYAPGDQIQIQGTLRLYSPAITGSTNLSSVSVTGEVYLVKLFEKDGHALAAENYFMSTALTPTGFPIQSAVRPTVSLGRGFQIGAFSYAGGNQLRGTFNIAARIPADLPDGIYSPYIALGFSGVPASTQWLAANVVRHTYWPNEASLPPVKIGTVSQPRLIWRLLQDDFVQGTRGTGAREDRGVFELASQIVSQGAPFYIPPVDARNGAAITYRLEPFLPMISFTDRRMPTPPLIPFDLPGGELHVSLKKPDGSMLDLGVESFAQSFNRTKTTRAASDLNPGTVQLDDAYSLKAASDRFRVQFDQYGHYTITMEGFVKDIWGNKYVGGGTYDLWTAYPLIMDPGVLPGTPLAVGDVFSPSILLSPAVPANVTLTLTVYPDSNPARAIARTVSGTANPYGYFSANGDRLTATAPGEYRVDLTAQFTDRSGQLYMGAMTWGGVVMSPKNSTDLIAHGRTGLDALTYIPNHWFVANRDLTMVPGSVYHTLNPYFNGDIVWTRAKDQPYGGDALILGSSVSDSIGVLETAIRARARRTWLPTSGPGSLDERFDKQEIPLFTSTLSGRPPQIDPDKIDQIAYAYRVSQRPGMRVREVVADDGQSGGYWRLDTSYDYQLGEGILGDLPNDFKFEYVGIVFRDLTTGHNEYLGQGSGWVFLSDDDPLGSRVMPPFSGRGNGGWTTEGGPILRLKGQDIDIFIMPTGTRPGTVLETGDTFRFSGHVMPTLDSQIAVTVTAPGGARHVVSGRANEIGYFYNPAQDLVVTEPGLWSVDVRVWHDGMCSGGKTISPYPSGDVLGSESGRYWFYVVQRGSARLEISSPEPGFLTFADNVVNPIPITGTAPSGLQSGTVDYTITLPGFILAHGQAAVAGGRFSITFDPATLHDDFPNLDLHDRDTTMFAGLSDAFSVSLLFQGTDAGGSPVRRAGTVTLHGDQVFIESRLVSAAPSAATLVSPAGTISASSPAFVWNAVANASYYQLWVDDSTAQAKIKKWFTAAETGCPTGTGYCSVVSPLSLSAGAGRWWIQTWNENGYGPWSEGLSFTITGAGPPGKAVLVAPAGGIAAGRPVFAWNAVSGATWYYLWVSDASGTAKVQKWFTAAETGCRSSTGTCSILSPAAFSSGAFQWWIQAWNESGYGPWSERLSFTITGAGPPGKAVLVAPAGRIPAGTPEFTWNSVTGSTWYYLWVSDASGAAKIQKWFTAAEAGCQYSTGPCSILGPAAFSAGAFQWWIQTWNESGHGPWSEAMAFTVSGSAPPVKSPMPRGPR